MAAINKRAQTAIPIVGGIQSDVSRANILGMLVSVDRHAVAILQRPGPQPGRRRQPLLAGCGGPGALTAAADYVFGALNGL